MKSVAFYNLGDDMTLIYTQSSSVILQIILRIDNIRVADEVIPLETKGSQSIEPTYHAGRYRKLVNQKHANNMNIRLLFLGSQLVCIVNCLHYI